MRVAARVTPGRRRRLWRVHGHVHAVGASLATLRASRWASARSAPLILGGSMPHRSLFSVLLSLLGSILFWAFWVYVVIRVEWP